MSNKGLKDKLLKASAIIQESSTKGSADYIVTSPTVGDVIQKAISQLRRDIRKEKIMRIFNEEVQG